MRSFECETARQSDNTKQAARLCLPQHARTLEHSVEALVTKQFSESLHLASAAICEEASTVLVPAVEMAKANPMQVTAVRADVDRARFGTLVIAAGVFFHGWHLGLRAERTRRGRSIQVVGRFLDSGRKDARRDHAHALRLLPFRSMARNYGVCGEVYLWGRVVEHTLGWRAQFAYPKNLILPLSLLPFTLAELNARLLTLIAFGIDIFVLHNKESMRLWKHGHGYDTNGLDYIISLRGEHYLRQQEERKLKKGDRVALLGRGFAVVKQIDSKDAVVIFGIREVLRIPLQEIVLNQHNRRWEHSG